MCFLNTQMAYVCTLLQHSSFILIFVKVMKNQNLGLRIKAFVACSE